MRKNSVAISFLSIFLISILSTSAYGDNTGEKVYENHCSVCHDAGIAGAQKIDDTEQWQKRLDEREIEGLYENSINGYNAMPAMGTCTDCSEQDIEKAVDYIIETAIE